jgi:hypothetical protein
MVAKDKLKKKIIILNGAPVDLDRFYPAIKDAFESQGFGLMETGQKYKEDQYGKQISWSFGAEKEYDEFSKVEVSINADFNNMFEVKEGRKKLMQGNVAFKFFPTLLLDYRDSWIGSNFLEYLFKFYKQVVGGKDIKVKYKDRASKELVKIYAEIKKFLEMYE